MFPLQRPLHPPQSGDAARQRLTTKATERDVEFQNRDRQSEVNDRNARARARDAPRRDDTRGARE